MWLRSESPPGLLRTDSKRPDGGHFGALVMWQSASYGMQHALIHTKRHPTSSDPPWRPALQQHWQNLRNCRNMPHCQSRMSLSLWPLRLLGSWGSLGLAFVSEVGRRISAVSGDPRSTSFLKQQRLQMAVQREMRRLLLETFGSGTHEDTDLPSVAILCLNCLVIGFV